MSETRYKNNPSKTLEEILPWTSGNFLQAILERKRREKLEVLKVVIQKEKEAVEGLPEEVRELIKIPEIEAMVDDP